MICHCKEALVETFRRDHADEAIYHRAEKSPQGAFLSSRRLLTCTPWHRPPGQVRQVQVSLSLAMT